MAWNNGNGNIIMDKRRRIVAAIMVRKPTASIREIQAKVGENLLNPETGEPYTHGTIHNDIREIRAQWREQAQRDYDEWIDERIAELTEVRESAWSKGDLDNVLRAHDRIVKLLGLDAPERLQIDWREKLPEGYDAEEVRHQFMELMIEASRQDDSNED